VSERATVWSAWLTRWNLFQDSYVPHRAEQLGLMRDYIAASWRTQPLRILDLCCGPGSVARCILEGLPNSEVVAVDWDPWLIELGRRTSVAAGHITWIEADLRERAWVDALPDANFHAALITSAVHWFDADEVERIYAQVAAALIPRGVFLISDRIPAGSEKIQALAHEALLRWQVSQTTLPGREDWPTFWGATRREPTFATLIAERDRRLGARRPFPALPLGVHQRVLACAGFSDSAEVWRWHEAAILLAIC
jgi:ubiquinone/menaquinone biosynthesis C-methylase UbiE